MQVIAREPPLLLAEGIHKRYGTNEVLKGVTVQANQGDVISRSAPAAAARAASCAA